LASTLNLLNRYGGKQIAKQSIGSIEYYWRQASTNGALAVTRQTGLRLSSNQSQTLDRSGCREEEKIEEMLRPET